MKKAITFFLGMLGLHATTACSQQHAGDLTVSEFAEFINAADVQVLDVRTAEEFAEEHLAGALNIDVKKDSFMDEVKKALEKNKKVAVYCRSGRRSANACNLLTKEGYSAVNLLGGIMKWKEEGKPVTNATYEVDVFTTKSGKPIRFHALMHACIRMEFDGKEIQIDPVSKLGNRTVDYTSMPKADYIFVTHEHGDHFNKETLELLKTEKTRVVTNKRCADMAGYGEIMANGDKKELAEGFSVEAVPAYNTTEGRTQFHPKGRDNGYILAIDGLRIYIAGDTEDIPEMTSIKDIDIAFLPCNQPYTMTTDQLVKAARVIKPKVVFPYHYGQTDVSGIAGQLKDEGIDVRIRHYE